MEPIALTKPSPHAGVPGAAKPGRSYLSQIVRGLARRNHTVALTPLSWVLTLAGFVRRHYTSPQISNDSFTWRPRPGSATSVGHGALPVEGVNHDHFHNVLAHSPMHTGLAFVPFGIMTIVANVAGNWLAARMSMRPVFGRRPSRRGGRLCSTTRYQWTDIVCVDAARPARNSSWPQGCCTRSAKPVLQEGSRCSVCSRSTAQSSAYEQRSFCRRPYSAQPRYSPWWL